MDNHVFQSAVDYVIRNEGGYVDHPNDPGGRTKYGITAVSFAEFFGREPQPGEIKAITLEQAKEIYFKNYWLKNRCDEMVSQAVATAVFDASVLFGVKSAAKFAQLAARMQGQINLATDGIIGPATLSALNTQNEILFIYGLKGVLTSHVMSLIKGNPKLADFKRGWISRINRLSTLVKCQPPPKNFVRV